MRKRMARAILTPKVRSQNHVAYHDVKLLYNHTIPRSAFDDGLSKKFYPMSVTPVQNGFMYVYLKKVNNININKMYF